MVTTINCKCKETIEINTLIDKEIICRCGVKYIRKFNPKIILKDDRSVYDGNYEYIVIEESEIKKKLNKILIRKKYFKTPWNCYEKCKQTIQNAKVSSMEQLKLIGYVTRKLEI